jgi:hypothetical protein
MGKGPVPREKSLLQARGGLGGMAGPRRAGVGGKESVRGTRCLHMQRVESIPGREGEMVMGKNKYKRKFPGGLK